MPTEIKNIVVLDDEKYICNIIKEALSEYDNFAVKKFTNPQKALDFISDESVDLVLTDLVMGDFSGVQVLEHTLKNHPDAVVILMTGYPTVKTAISVLKKGGYDYLVKPFKLEDLKATIRRGLENQRIKRENVELRSQLELMKVTETVARGIKLQPLLHLIVDSAVDVLPAQAASILLKNRRTCSFHPRCLAGDTSDTVVMNFLRHGQLPPGQKPERGECHAVNDEVVIDGRRLKRSFISMPLVSRGEITGMFNLVYVDRFANIAPGQERMVSLLVSTAASAVESNYLDRNLKRSYFQTITALANAVEARDRYTAGHTDRVYRLARVLAGKMGWDNDRLAELRTGCLLHDIGKIGVPDAILNKPGILTEYERKIMMKHPEMGARILKGIRFLKPMIPYIISHHERFDGSGYPHGLAGKDIPIEGRLLAVVDTFDAIISDRPYRKGRPPETALNELLEFRGIQFDPVIVDLFNEAYRDGDIRGEMLGASGPSLKMRMLIPS